MSSQFRKDHRVRVLMVPIIFTAMTFCEHFPAAKNVVLPQTEWLSYVWSSKSYFYVVYNSRLISLSFFNATYM